MFGYCIRLAFSREVVLNYISKAYIYKVALTGIQPTGKPHLGNYISVIKPSLKCVDFNNISRLFLLVADLHALTSQKSNDINQHIFELVSVLIACGFYNDPLKTPIFLQSSVCGLTELSWILSTVCSVLRLSRLPQWREKSGFYSKESGDCNKSEYLIDDTKQLFFTDNIVSTGLFTYPILQASDILLFDSYFVPVGVDQVLHIELARDLVRSAIHKWPLLSGVFRVPEALIFDIPKVNSLRNPTKKMSKSDDSEFGTIYLTDSSDIIRKKIRRAQTDSIKHITYDLENRPGVSNLLRILAALMDRSVDVIVHQISGWSKEDLKNEVSEAIIEEFRPIRDRVFELQNTKEGYFEVKSCLESGSGEANQVASRRLELIRSAVGCQLPSFSDVIKNMDFVKN